jgi:hypothetical protein
MPGDEYASVGRLMGDRSFFIVFITSTGPEESFIQVFWAWAEHPGEAVDKVLAACDRMGVQNAHAMELNYYDDTLLPDEVVHDEMFDVTYEPHHYIYPTVKVFIPPRGIIRSHIDAEQLDPDLIRQGFGSELQDDSSYRVEVVLEQHQLFWTFDTLMKRLPSITVFWVSLTTDWEGIEGEEIWVNEALNTPESIADYLLTHVRDTLDNGYVTLMAYSDVGRTNLFIDSHKTIKVLTESEDVQAAVIMALRDLGLPELDELYRLEFGYYHWHYRPQGSKSRAELVTALSEHGFSHWRPHHHDETQFN